MEIDIVIFWFVVLSCVSGLVVVTTRLRSASIGWAMVYVGILLISSLGWALKKSWPIYTGFTLWLLLVVVPALLARLYYRFFLQQRYAAAQRVARFISWLHPTDGWREQPEIVGALELARCGDLDKATEILRRFQEVRSVIGIAAVTNLYRITNQWEELLNWQSQHYPELERHPQLLPVLLRAHGEIGDLRGLAELYERNQKRIAKLVPPASRDLCRLMLFSFCGQRQAVQLLLSGSLSILPDWSHEFWTATTDLAAGDFESAKTKLEKLIPIVDPPVRMAVERRLSRLSVATPPPDTTTQTIIDQATREHGHEERFGARRSLFSKDGRATQLLILINVGMFLVETLLGGSTNGETLYRLGALFPAAVRAGEWWRLAASLFLHLGMLHLAMNMFALWVLGPFAEFALGSLRYLVVYLVAGIGSMGTVLLFATGPRAEQLTVGASGCIMGLVGATGALMLRGWIREKALTARRRLMGIVVIVLMQSIFDLMVPQVSMTAHLSGALIGFIAAAFLRDRFVFAR